MRKDKEWLKEEVDKIQKEYDSEILLNSHARYMVMDIKEIIDQLEEPEITEEQAWEVIAQKYGGKSLENNIGYIKSEGYAVVKKPVIPQYVAGFIESYRNHSLHSALQSAYEGFEDLQVYNWINNGKREETLTRAWLDGYEVEKEKLYMVVLSKVNDVQRYVYLDKDGNVRKSTNLTNTGLFKESDIKKIDERYWLFAEEVTE